MFRRSLLVRTQGDIFRLGLFEDVQVDFAPAESSDVDINLKVKEKQVGTASAGAGYTSESGLTGFVELGHNNVLGNGQSLSLHLERGGRRSDYYLSFTEPWFRDTPTLLGFSIFNTNRDRDIYTEARAGGSVRLGRPLRWPDFSRGSITYRLENVKITQLRPLSLADSIALAGINLGAKTLTSSVELQFIRNTANNPFYPTRGTRLTVDDEFAGGPFGGSINFHKHRIDGRVYLPSIMPRFTTMVRARFGLLGAYGDQRYPFPTYERFRLGGGTTLEPLRGYDDYQVVPAKFSYFVTTADTFDRVAPVQLDSIRISRTHVRYPGGAFMSVYTVEQQFPVVHPLHGVLFFDAGNTWDLWSEIRPLDLKVGAGIGFRMEIPLLGNIGFDYGYGFHRDDRPKARGHLLLGNVNF
jgi:outer membrane protein insertion porin family